MCRSEAAEWVIIVKVYENIKKLVMYGIEEELISSYDAMYARNRLLECMKLSDYIEPRLVSAGDPLEKILAALLDDACERGIIEDTVTCRDLFDTKLMDCITPRPGEVVREFMQLYDNSPRRATDWFYRFCQSCDYIRAARVKKDRKWIVATEYGDLDITINLSKPEKDPRDIAAARNAAQSGYPKCQLCAENEGYAGRMNHPARQTLRLIPMQLSGEDWALQYSPYSYYNEHCILLNRCHIPMKIDKSTFVKLMDFTTLFPHYFLGSNADLPIVGGSILSHDHFQGGRYCFAMEKAPVEQMFTFNGFEGVKAGIVKWPMSVIRLRSGEREDLVELAAHILGVWRAYTDESAFIFAETDGEKHNTITPIARRRGGDYEIDLVLRNNITTASHPLGVFHPHEQLHHIKKENIGLIEVMGLAVLPARLKTELQVLSDSIYEHADLRARPETAPHADWAQTFIESCSGLDRAGIDEVLQEQVGLVFVKVLECAGVFKRTQEGVAAFERFINAVNASL